MGRRPSSWLLLSVALAVAPACRCGPGVTGVEGELAVEPSGLAFGDTWVGFPSTKTLTLTSRTRAPLDVTLEASPEVFSVESARVTVGGGASVDVVVRFAPTAEGDAVGLVQVGDRSIPLSGRGVLPPDCRGGRQCVTSTFSPDAGGCVDVPVPAGTACTSSNVCLRATQCLGGECVGQPVPCDDRDACTLDACDGAGCLHRPLECPAPADPCQVAACDPASGCGARDAPDGTACGPNDCATANVCVAGRCVTATAPNGSECQPATRCQPAGRCQDGTCQRANPNLLQPAWTYTPAPGWTLDWWTGLQMDPLGNIWFRECQGSCPTAPVQHAVSLAPTGVLRFTAPLGANSVRDTFSLRASQLITDGLVITFSGDGVTALSTATGAVVWTTPLPAFTPDAASEPLIGQWLVAPAPGVVAVGYSKNGVGVLGLSTQTGRGEWIWRSTTGSFLDEAISDEHGNLVFGTYDGVTRVVSVDLQGQQRWSVPGRADMVSAYDGTLGMIGELRPMSTGGPAVPFGQLGAPVTCSWASFIGHPQDRGRVWGFTNGTCGTNTRAVFIIDLARRMTTQLGTTSSFIRVPALTTRGTFMAIENAAAGQDELVEYAPGSRTACTLQGSAIDASIDHGMLVRLIAPSRIDAFPLPGVYLAPQGWVTSRGDSTRRGRPR